MSTQTAIPPRQRCAAGGAAIRTFLLAAVRNPTRVGAIVPSSSRLAASLASVVPNDGVPVVVELGPGTGAVSAAIEARLPRGGRHVAVEVDVQMAAFLRRHRPGVEVVNGDARDLVQLLAGIEINRAAAVVSGLPWSLFDTGGRERILRQVAESIGLDGVFITFAYVHARPLHGARAFRRSLEQTFDEVLVSPVVWQNMPPAYCYICRRPRLRSSNQDAG